MTSDPLRYEPGTSSAPWTSLHLPVWNYEEFSLSSTMLILSGILSQWWRKSLSCSVFVDMGEFQRGRITFQKHMVGCGPAIQFWVFSIHLQTELDPEFSSSPIFSRESTPNKNYCVATSLWAEVTHPNVNFRTPPLSWCSSKQTIDHNSHP